MTLGRLIQILSVMDPKTVVPNGFTSPHSYRGYYEQLAFEPMGYVSVKEMLKSAKSAVGKTFTGYKGGNFTMDLGTDIWISDYGNTAAEDHSLTELELAYMFETSVADLGTIHHETAVIDREGFVATDILVPAKFKGKEVEVIVRLK